MSEITSEDRLELGRLIAESLTNIGDSLINAPLGNGESRASRGAGIVIQFGADLILGAMSCAESEALYASMALHRQLIEVYHLLAYFAAEPAAAARWLGAGEGEFLSGNSEFRPATLRRAINASNEQYSSHCALAGHPRPFGRIFVPSGKFWDQTMPIKSLVTNEDIDADIKDVVICDGLIHSHDVLHIVSPLASRLDESVKYLDAFLPIWFKVEGWAHSDPLARIEARN